MLEYRDEKFNVKSADEIRKDSEEEHKRRESQCETDWDAYLQPNITPNVDNSLISFQVEYLFQYNDDDCNPYTAWCEVLWNQ